MKRLGAVICLAFLMLFVLYVSLWVHARNRLARAGRETLERLSYLSGVNADMAKLYFESNRSRGASRSFGEKAFTRAHPGILIQSYSDLGIPKHSVLPPVPTTVHPRETPLLGAPAVWLLTRRVSAEGGIWVETLGSRERWPVDPRHSGAPIDGVAAFIPKTLLVSHGANPELVLSGKEPRGLSRLFILPVRFREEAGAPAPGLFLHFRIPFWVHALFFLLTWAGVVTFVRILRYKPIPGSPRETQLEEELAYLSKTYQSLSRSLRMERQKVEAILNSAPDGIFTCSPEGIVTFWNRSMETLTKIPKDAAVKKHFRDHMTVSSAGGQLLADPLVLRTAQEKNLNLMDCQIQTHSSGESESEESAVIPVALGAAPVMLADGTVEEIVITVKDIRSQKEAEALRKDMQAMITHDLRSPLSAILGYAGLIRNSKITKNEEDAQKYLDSLVRAGKEMLILISNLLGWSWMEEGRLSFHKESLAVAPILKETAEGLGVLAKPKNLSMLVDAPENLWALTDGDKLKEILNNLISNAIKFSRPGGTIHVTAVLTRDKVRISVADQGPGLSDQEKADLFQKFSGIRKQGSGTGLGLYIVKTLTEALDGTVEVESEPGAGSTFSLLLPAFQSVSTHAEQLSLMSLVAGGEQAGARK